jgi:hypothetical protein
MTAHTCKTITPGCYRCELSLDEVRAAEQEVREEAQAAWIAYRDDYQRTHHLSARRTASQMRRREFIAGYLAANDMGAVSA